ncbi:MAG: hypothetical protein M3N49_13055 [Candidatus Eremiobacteraeota bacterium]|nr:hypothetical protein [Candidatus Eremiobacteraeota bacterium]
MTQILVVGDSNTIVFDDLLFEHPTFFAQPFVTRGVFCPGLMAANFTEPSGELNSGVLDSLFRSLLLTGNAVAWHARHVPLAQLRPTAERAELAAMWPRFKTPANDHLESRPIVIMLGTLDLEAILRTLPAGCDFALQDDRYALPAFAEKPVGPYVPAQLVNDLVAERLKPLAHGLALLRDRGFENVYLHSLHPPPLEDYKYVKIRTANNQASLRYKVALAINAQFRALCEREGIGFLDMWGATTRDGALDPRFEFDGDHLNKEAAYLTVCRLLADLAKRAFPKQLDLSDLAREQRST